MDRRDFIKSTVAMLALPELVYSQNNRRRRLLLIELKGGNDGLNTVVPYSQNEYYKLRNKIAIPRDQVIQLDEQVGLHPAMNALHKIWAERDMAIIQGIGYNNPNRSHFRSIEIWETGSKAEEYLSEGWLARSIFANSSIDSVADAIALGQASLGSINGEGLRTLVMSNAGHFLKRAKRVPEQTIQSENSALSHLLSVQHEIKQAANKLTQMKIEARDEGRGFTRDINRAAKLLTSDRFPSVVKVFLGSFDTHVNQSYKHKRLLEQLTNGIVSFREQMQAADLWNETLVMTYSEFGRRAAQNNSNGTDHGTAAPHFVFGGRVKGGLYGQYPDLRNLVNKDLLHTVEVREYYKSIEREWMLNCGKGLGIVG